MKISKYIIKNYYIIIESNFYSLRIARTKFYSELHSLQEQRGGVGIVRIGPGVKWSEQQLNTGKFGDVLTPI